MLSFSFVVPFSPGLFVLVSMASSCWLDVLFECDFFSFVIVFPMDDRWETLINPSFVRSSSQKTIIDLCDCTKLVLARAIDDSVMQFDWSVRLYSGERPTSRKSETSIVCLLFLLSLPFGCSARFDCFALDC